MPSKPSVSTKIIGSQVSHTDINAIVDHNLLKADIATTVGFAKHGSDATYVRPDHTVVFWFGSVDPDNMADGDVSFITP